MCDCLFCKIISGEIPSYKVFEDDHAFAFLDIHPIERGHTLVLPKVHAETLFNLPPEELAGMMPAVQRVATLLKKKINCDGMTICQNNGVCAGQTIGHVHFHLIPRWNEKPILWEVTEEISPADAITLSQKMGLS